MQLVIMIILALACCFFANAHLTCREDGEHKKSLVMKALASACFVAAGGIAVTGCWYTRFGYLTLGGLCFGLFGDVLLGLRYMYPKKKETFFAAGGACFAAGHVLYVIALTGLTPKVMYFAAPYVLLGFVLAHNYLKKRGVKVKKLIFPGGLYELLVLFMGGCAVGAAVFALSPGTILFAVAGVFFAMSDNMLAAEQFGSAKSADRRRGLSILYYSAQIFIAFSLILLFVI